MLVWPETIFAFCLKVSDSGISILMLSLAMSFLCGNFANKTWPPWWYGGHLVTNEMIRAGVRDVNGVLGGGVSIGETAVAAGMDSLCVE